MKIRMTTLSASPRGVFMPGQTLTVDDDKALELIRRGFAVAVGAIAAERRETATQPQPEARALCDVPGIGDVRAKQLIELGILTASDLAGADAATIADALDGVGAATARRWTQAARRL